MDPLHSEAIHSERPIRIICIGAGASGLLLAYKLQRSFRRFELTVIEQVPTHRSHLTLYRSLKRIAVYQAHG